MSESQENVTPEIEEQPAKEESTLFSAPAKVEKQKPGKKRVLPLIITLCVLVVLGGGVTAAYFGGLFNEEETSEVSEEESEVLLPSLADYSATGISAIEKITVKNDTGTYSLVAGEHGEMVVEGYEDLPRDAAAVENLLVQYTAVTPDLVIAENPTDEQFAACGLDTPAITVTTKYTDGKTLTVQYGRVATGGSSGYYGMEQGGDTVWLFREDYYQAAMNDKTYYVGKTLMTAPSPKDSDSVGTTKLKAMTLSGGNRAEDVSMRYVSPDDGESIKLCGKYVLEKPYFRPTDSNVTGEWDTELCGLYGATIAAIHPTDADLQKYGLSVPRAVTTMTFGVYVATDEMGNALDKPSWYNEVSYTISLGNRTEDDTYYALLDGVDIVYTVNAATVPWAETDYEELVNKSLFLRYITELSGINATVGGDTYALKFTHGKQKDENGTETATLKATLNGKDVPEGNVRSLYEAMMSVKRVAIAADAKTPSDTSALTLELLPLSGETDTAFAFRPYSANRYLCVANDGEKFLVKAADVETLTAQLNTLAALGDESDNASKKAAKETSKKNNP